MIGHYNTQFGVYQTDRGEPTERTVLKSQGAPRQLQKLIEKMKISDAAFAPATGKQPKTVWQSGDEA